jgi:type IV secretion system protein TrbL
MTSWSPEFFQTIMGPFVNNPGWFGAIYNYALPLYFMMAAVSLGFVVGYGVVTHDMAGMAADLGHTVIGIGVGWVILNNADIIGNAIYNTFVQIAGAVGGLPASALTPDGLMVYGAEMIGTMFSAVGFGTWLLHPLGAVIILLIALLIFLFFLVMAGLLMVLIIEAFFAIIGGTIFIPFGAFHWTSSFLNMWLMWIMAVSVQLFFFYLVLSIGLTMEIGWAAQLAARSTLITSNLWVAFIALAQALTFMFIATWLPLQARRMVYGSGPSVGFGSMIRGAAAALGAAGGVAGEAASNIAAGGVASSAGSAAASSASASSSSAFQNMMAQP